MTFRERKPGFVDASAFGCKNGQVTTKAEAGNLAAVCRGITIRLKEEKRFL